MGSVVPVHDDSTVDLVARNFENCFCLMFEVAKSDVNTDLEDWSFQVAVSLQIRYL
jgi:hypothetical protein